MISALGASLRLLRQRHMDLHVCNEHHQEVPFAFLLPQQGWSLIILMRGALCERGFIRACSGKGG